MKNSKLVVAAFAALSLTAGQAMAQEEGGEGEGMGGDPCAGGEMHEGDGAAASENTSGMDDGDIVGDAPSLVTPQGKIAVRVELGIGLSKDFDPLPIGGVGKPISLAPDIFYGAANKLEVGLAHSGHAITGFWADTTRGGIVGSGVCVTGDEGGCASVYNGPIGILARYQVVQGGIDLAVDGGPVIRALDSNGSADGGDMLLGFKVGVRGRKVINKLSIGFAPNINIGLNQRGDDEGGNKELLSIPVDLYFGVTDTIAVGLQTGISGPLSEFGDNVVVPLTVGGAFMINDKMSAGLTFNIHRLYTGADEGDNGPGAADFRSLGLHFAWHN